MSYETAGDCRCHMKLQVTAGVIWNCRWLQVSYETVDDCKCHMKLQVTAGVIWNCRWLQVSYETSLIRLFVSDDFQSRLGWGSLPPDSQENSASIVSSDSSMPFQISTVSNEPLNRGSYEFNFIQLVVYSYSSYIVI